VTHLGARRPWPSERGEEAVEKVRAVYVVGATEHQPFQRLEKLRMFEILPPERVDPLRASFALHQAVAKAGVRIAAGPRLKHGAVRDPLSPWPNWCSPTQDAAIWLHSSPAAMPGRWSLLLAASAATRLLGFERAAVLLCD